MIEVCSDLHVRVWGDGGDTVVLLHGCNAAPASTWTAQRALADHYRLLVPDRRGYGDSPPMEPARDYEADVRDVLALLGDGAHLVGFSAGAIMALLAAARRPDLVHSLALLEPPACQVARGHPAVEAYLARIDPLYASRPHLSPERFLDAFMRLHYATYDKPLRPLPPQHLRGVQTIMQEPAPWDVALPVDALDALAAAPCPKLVVSGAWFPAFEVVADTLAARLEAQRAAWPGHDHYVQRAGAPFNALLVAFWERAAEEGAR